jgi:hypothetical protein
MMPAGCVPDPIRRLLVVAMPLAVTAGCAATAPSRPASDDTPLLRLPPAALGRRLALQQQLLVQAGGRQQHIDVLLESDEHAVRLVLLNLGQTAARLEWDGRELVQTHAPWWPQAVGGERVLSDLQLALWPVDAVGAALPAGWTLEPRDGQRHLRRGSEIVATVSYPTPTRIELVHRLQRYRIDIESQPLEGAP